MVKASLTPTTARAPRSTAATRARNTSTKPYVPPFTIIVDTRESAPYTFTNLHELGRNSYRPSAPSVVRQGLPTGDYSIQGLTDHIVIERKSLKDLFGSLSKWQAPGEPTSARDRFRAEHDRMQRDYIRFGRLAYVVIEASIGDVRALAASNNPTELQGAHPNNVLETAIKWPDRFGVPWVWAGSRDDAEWFVYRKLASVYATYEEEQRAAKRAEVQQRIEELKNSTETEADKPPF